MLFMFYLNMCFIVFSERKLSQHDRVNMTVVVVVVVVVEIMVVVEII